MIKEKKKTGWSSLSLKEIQDINDEAKKRDICRYYLSIADNIRISSNSNRMRVGCIIVRNDEILSSGFNNTIELTDELVSIHAEEDAIKRCEFKGIDLSGSTIYTSLQPCMNCSDIIAKSGIKEVVYSFPYPKVLSTVDLEDYLNDKGVRTVFVWRGVILRRCKK